MTSHKKNRSNIYTVGMCNTFYNNDERIMLFDVDRIYTNYKTGEKTINKDFHEELKQVHIIYNLHKLDYIWHPTKQGIHFISPTMLTKKSWKEIMDSLNKINKSCPMTTLRMKPNKYDEEDLIFYNAEYQVYLNNSWRNSKSVCELIYNTFGIKFECSPLNDCPIKTVSYPLPKSDYCK